MEENFYTYGEAEAAKIAEFYKTPQKGGYEFRYIDMPKAIKIMREFRAMKGLGSKVVIRIKESVRPRRQETFVKIIKNTICPFTGIMFGKFQGIDPKTSIPKWSSIELSEYRELNLENDIDAADWIIFRACPFIENTCTASRNSSVKFWEIIDNRVLSNNIVQKTRTLTEIEKLLSTLGGIELANLARLFMMPISPGDERNITIVDIEGYLLEIAYRDPIAFMAKYKLADRGIMEIIYAAQAINVINYNMSDGYTAFGSKIGLTLEESISYMRQDRNLYAMIRKEIVGRDIFAARIEALRPTTKTKAEAVAALSASPAFQTPANDPELDELVAAPVSPKFASSKKNEL